MMRPARRKREQAPDALSSGDFVEALARGLAILRCFEPGVSSLSNHELAQRTGLPKSTVSRLLYTLAALGYLRYDMQTGRYAPGYNVLALGFGCLASLEVRVLVRPLMEELGAATGAAVALGAFDGETMTYLDAVHGSPELFLRLSVGHRVGMSSAMGKAYLAAQPPEKRRELLAALDPEGAMDAMMHTAFDDYETDACCYAIGDWHPGINAVAAPFKAIGDDAVFVISCGGPASFLAPEHLRTEVSPMLRRAIAQLSGSQFPPP